MDEQRLEAYANLIQHLLQCPSGREIDVLMSNGDLVDTGLVLVIERFVEMAIKQGEQDAADFLGNIAMQLKILLEMDMPLPTHMQQNQVPELSLNSKNEAYFQVIKDFLDLPDILDIQLDLLTKNINLIVEISFARFLDGFINEASEHGNQELTRRLQSLSDLAHSYEMGAVIFDKSNRETAYRQLVNLMIYLPPSVALTANQDLVDIGLVRTMLQVSKEFEGGKSGYLMELAENLSQHLGISLTLVALFENYSDPHIDFLARVLSLLSEDSSTSDDFLIIAAFPQDASISSQQIQASSLINENINLLDEHLIVILNQRIRTAFSELKPDQLKKFVGALFLFSIVSEGLMPDTYRGITLDSLSIVKEIVITAYEVASSFFDASQVLSADDFANLQYSVGNAYKQRNKGNRVDNLKLAINHLSESLKFFTFQKSPIIWEDIHSTIGVLYFEISSKVLSVLEQVEYRKLSICHYLNDLQLFSFESSPRFWAYIHHGLGNSYLIPTDSATSEDIEAAIYHYKQALKVFTKNQPKEWSAIHHNLGVAYFERIEGKKADNLEKAIEFYLNALEIRNKINEPKSWAETQANLANTYSSRIRGEHSENLENSIRICQQVLEVRTRENSPQEWAKSQHNLAYSYSYRTKGDRSENLENSIKICQEVLEVFNRVDFPQNWAMTQNTLASAYMSRVKGDRSKNIEASIYHWQQALEVYTKENCPKDWAMVQNNLASAYGKLFGDVRSKITIEASIYHFQQALQIYSKENLSQDWAMVQHNLASTYMFRINGDRSENIELAISTYRNSLEVRTRQGFPIQWAMTQNNLGFALTERIQGDPTENLELAIAAYFNSLEVRTRQGFPQEYTESQVGLGLAYRKAKQWSDSRQAFDSAIETVDFLRGEIVSGDETKRKINEEWNDLYKCMVEVCVEMEDYRAAITYAERGKARNLVELIANKDLYALGEIPIEIQQRIQYLRQQIYQESRRLGQIPEIERDTTHINHFRQEFQNLFPYQPLTYTEIQSLSNPHTTILEWYLTKDKFILFILSGGEKGNLTLWQSSKLDLENLIVWADNYVKTYKLKLHWREFLDIHLADLTRILHLDEIIKQYIPKDCEQLILIPHLFLHLFPIHALPLNDGSYLIDRFPQGIRYAPSCQILQRIQQRQQPTIDSDQRLLAIRNPTEDLDYTNLEVDAICKLFQPSDILKGKAATKDALHQQYPETAQYAHFSCHGYFNFENPLQSALLLAGCKISPLPPEPDPSRYLPTSETSGIDLHKCLTLEDIFRLDLRQCRLVVLSACETGITDLTSSSDEYIGLPSAFLYAGASNVVSSLWSVSDLSTAFLMIRFYEYFQGNTSTQDAKNNAAMSLKLAQQWLRDSTKADLRAWSIQNESYFSRNQNMHIAALFDHSYQDVPNNQKIFASPFYWAAFQSIGK